MCIDDCNNKNVINIINNVYCGAKCVSFLGPNILNMLYDKRDDSLWKHK